MGIEPKLLTPKKLEKVKRAVEIVDGQPPMELASRLLGHIAALETENKQLKKSRQRLFKVLKPFIKAAKRVCWSDADPARLNGDDYIAFLNLVLEEWPDA